ncbi:cytochrome c-type biogenesis protein [Alteromonas sp. KUL49]|uniref:cytochrome c-type biogenesis protein n=1 Tax=Alteromonas sp. KUL49 TaxID=2480798 RepID=UPI00102F2350|nr:cytochrome c-type biogenesis protein [Alteromonas sp. KUL49]TAP35002.1 cytochrome c-type biogenesis protein CcmH [Alteromonas sp. KUL49]GEA13448.1 cytochrome c-type biogenesis protein CcmH [Alteromonas sp. KUL49]
MRWLLLTLLVLSNLVLATEDSYEFDTPQQRETFLTLTQELRCPMCQNQNIADSDAMIAHDMRRKVYTLVQEGKSEQQVINYMKVRYGDFVHYKPPVTFATLWLWLTPVMFVLLALLFVVFRKKTSTQEDIEAKLAKANAMLEQEK